jgi:hypothetical protein
MARMTRKQIYIEPDQDRRLRALSRRRSKTESELVREGIDRVLSTPPLSARDHKAWKEELAFIDHLTRLGPVKGKRTWTREELYDERLSRRH